MTQGGREGGRGKAETADCEQPAVEACIGWRVCGLERAATPKKSLS